MNDPATRSSLLARAFEPVDGASLAAFRVLFGLVVAFASLRFVVRGWVERFFGTPETFVPYPLLPSLPAPPVPVMTALFAVMVLAGVGIALGVRHRVCAAVFFAVFTYVELIDVANYLNHYYLVSLLSLLLVFLPADAVGALAPHRRGGGSGLVPRWAVWLVRFQIAVVYVYAGLAKVNADWLLHGQPLNIWLSARSSWPVVGPLFENWWVAVLASWIGCLHDLLIVPALLWRRTRGFAYAALVSFHVATGLMFRIGLFPLIMISSALIWFDPDWPRQLARRLAALPVLRRTDAWTAAARPDRAPSPGRSSAALEVTFPPPSRRRTVLAALGVWCALQVFVPLRSYAYPGDVQWHEQGMRWGWRVMLSEKTGSLTYVVRSGEREWLVSPSCYLTPHQERELAARPDLILVLARRIAEDQRSAGHGAVSVHADALVSWNGRAPARLIDPSVDLGSVRPSLRAADWILPQPHTRPPRLHR